MADWQVAVIGAGPGGYAAAIRCAQLGLKTVCIDERLSTDGKQPSLGGTCLNIGCIPSKVLLEDSLQYSRLKEGHPAFKVRAPAPNIAKLMERKNKVVEGLCKGVAQLCSGNGVECIYGRAQLLAPGQIQLDGKTDITAEHIIMAPGSVPVEIPAAPFNGKQILDSTAALSLPAVPSTLAIIGAGAIGLELGSVWARLGAKVQVLEALEDFLPMLDREVARQAQRALASHGLDIQLGCRVTAAAVEGERSVQVSWQQGDATHAESFERLIVAVGRRPATEGLLATGCGLQTDDKGMIVVDDYCATAVPNVWAVGDVVRGPMLAHKATEEGVMVAERIAGEAAQINYPLIPAVIYTHPEIATVGQTETDCAAAGVDCSSGRFSFAANGRALASGEGEGMVKLVGCPVPNPEGSKAEMRIVGAQVVGSGAAELIQQVAIAMEFGAVAEDLALTTFSHPSVSEVLHEAALDLAGRPLHQIKKKRGRAKK